MQTKKKTQIFYEKETDPILLRSQKSSNFKAVKNLIDAEKHISTVNNRIKVLQLIDNKNNVKMLNQMRTIQKIHQIRDESSKENMMLKQIQRHKLEEMEELKIKNQRKKRQMSDHIHEVNESILKEKALNHDKVIQKSKKNQQKIKKDKQCHIKQQEQKRNKVVLDESSTRQNIVRYYETKLDSINTSKVQEVHKVWSKKEKKEQQLKKMSEIEMKFVQKRKESQFAYQQIKNKLDLLLNGVKRQKCKCKDNLKSSIHFSKSTDTNISLYNISQDEQGRYGKLKTMAQ